MAQVQQLYQLQEVELASRQRRQALETVEARLADHSVVETARAKEQEAWQHLNALRQQQRDGELELSSLEAKIRITEGKLFGGTVGNPKELLGLQEDLKQLRKQKDALEERLLGIMGQVEDQQFAVRSLAAHLHQAEEIWQKDQGHLTQERERLARELSELEEKRKTLLGEVDRRDLSLYEALKGQRGGLAVAKVERGMCRGCGLMLPSHELQRARAARELVRCNSCGRILYLS